MDNHFSDIFSMAINEHNDALKSLSLIQTDIISAAQRLVEVSKNGGVVYWCGNGGSAADCQHYAAELMVRYKKNRRPIRSIALTTDTSLLTAHCNDIAFDSIFERQVQSLVRPEDVVIGISTSGNSENVIKALLASKDLGAASVSMLGGDGGKMKGIADFDLCVESRSTASIQECHLIIGHYLCRCIEESVS